MIVAEVEKLPLDRWGRRCEAELILKRSAQTCLSAVAMELREWIARLQRRLYKLKDAA